MRARGLAPALLLLAAVLAWPAPAQEQAQAFDFDRYQPTSLQKAEQPADGTCDRLDLPRTITDQALPPMRLKAQATLRFRPIAADAVRVFEQYDKSTRTDHSRHFAEEVAVRIDGAERWLPIAAPVVPFWRDELVDGQAVWLYVSRFGCVVATDPAADRAILSINEFQIEPIGQPEPTP